VPDGEAYGYLGANAAGKTSTIRLLLGRTAQCGRAELFGLDVWRYAVTAHRSAPTLRANPGCRRR
jgi:ABC-type multidrug transport system ATPase subunit